MEEANPRLLAFESRALDYVDLPSELADHALDPSNQLKPAYAARGVTLARLTQPALQYAYFNMEDPVVGGYTNDKVALRRAIVLAFNTRRDDSRRATRARRCRPRSRFRRTFRGMTRR